MIVVEWLGNIVEGLIGVLLILAGLFGIRLSRRLSAPKPSPAVAPVDAVADLIETKAEIRRDELRRWAEAWQRAADLPDFWAAVQEIREVEYRAVREDRERRAAAETAKHLLEIEERQAARTARLEAERRQADEERAAIAAHQAHLADRRRRYAEARRTR